MREIWQRILIAFVVIVCAAVAAKVVDWRIARHELAPGSVTRYRVLRRSIFAAIVFVGVLSALLVIAGALAKLIDARIVRRDLDPAVATRYRVLRRSIFTAIVFVGVLSALLVIPQIRAIAGGVLASSALIGLVIGFASQRTIGNLVAGVLIAISQPLRLGDEVEVQGTRGVVEEIGLTYTWIRTRDNDRLVVPNERLASETIRNSTIRSAESLAEVTVQTPAAGLRQTVESLKPEGEVYVTDLAGENATIVVRKWIPGEGAADQASSDLRIRVAERLAEPT